MYIRTLCYRKIRKDGQTVLEYCLIAAVFFMVAFVYWSRTLHETKRALDFRLQDAIRRINGLPQ